MYRFTIYNIEADSLAGKSNPPGRVNLQPDQPKFTGAWLDGIAWADAEAETLPTGQYVCVATSADTLEPQGIWAFTVQEALTVWVAVDFVEVSVKAGI